jgi:RNA polymerase sigma factor (sigma-70 family)
MQMLIIDYNAAIVLIILLIVRYKEAVLNREKLILDNIPLIKKMTQGHYFYYRQDALLALIEAINGYDEKKNTKSSSLQSRIIFKVKMAIKDARRNDDAVTKNMRKKIKEYETAVIHLTNKNMKEPSEYDVAEYLGQDINYDFYIIQSLSCFRDCELNEFELYENPDIDAIISEKQQKQILLKSINGLNKKEKFIIMQLHYEGNKMADVGNKLKLSESRISQINKEAIKKLRKSICNNLSLN